MPKSKVKEYPIWLEDENFIDGQEGFDYLRGFQAGVQAVFDGAVEKPKALRNRSNKTKAELSEEISSLKAENARLSASVVETDHTIASLRKAEEDLSITKQQVKRLSDNCEALSKRASIAELELADVRTELRNIGKAQPGEGRFGLLETD